MTPTPAAPQPAPGSESPAPVPRSAARVAPSAEDLAAEFLLDPEVVFLNHGSFGACPRPVFEAYQAWQRRMELQPVLFLGREIVDLLREARGRLAAALGAARDDLVFVPNATTGVNILAHSLARGLAPGDEVLSTDHEYGACERAWAAALEGTGVRYRRVPIPVPVTTHTDLVESVWRAVGPRTRLLFLSHISSPTGLILPVAELVARARATGIVTVIDGAHAPGQIPMDLEALGADFYTGNCHKWLCAPKGAGFLHARGAMRERVRPLVVSWGLDGVLASGDPFIDELEWAGTGDYAAYLAVPEAIDFQAARAWPTVRARCHALLREARAALLAIPGIQAIHPDDPAWYAQMEALLLPEGVQPTALQAALYARSRVELPMQMWNGRPILRVSIQGYNRPSDVEALVEGLGALLG